MSVFPIRKVDHENRSTFSPIRVIPATRNRTYNKTIKLSETVRRLLNIDLMGNHMWLAFTDADTDECTEYLAFDTEEECQAFLAHPDAKYINDKRNADYYLTYRWLGYRELKAGDTF